MKLLFVEKTIFENVLFEGIICENVFWMLEQPVNDKGCSSIQFLRREFYQEYENFFSGKFFFFFFFSSLGLKVPFPEI